MEGAQHYEWDRFWIASDSRLAVGTDVFLPDPLAEDLWQRSPIEARRLSELDEVPCLVLLGEPGLGKSEAVRDVVREAERAPEHPLLQRLDLGAYPDAGALGAKLIEGEKWRGWTAEGRNFHLFLDGLDEARLHFPTVHKFLLSELEEVRDSLPRLKLRIVCRSADWLPELTAGLRDMWPATEEPAIQELSLAPLREIDVRTASLSEGLDADRFLGEVRDRDLEGLASLPLTLKMLLAAAREDDSLPATRAALYSNGVLHLLQEPEHARRVEGTPTVASVGERLALAERAAAATLLSRRFGVALAPSRARRNEIDPAELRFSDAHDRLGGGDRMFEVTESKVLETIRTALFARAAPDAVTFAHRSLAEYCAGACLANADLADDGLSRLLFASSDAEGRLVPELREVAAWAAALSPTVLQKVLAAEPEVLLRVDRLELDDEQRAEVVAAIMNVDSAERLERWDRRIWRSLSALDHPAIADQLNPWISDPETNWAVRRLAITIARTCEVTACETTLLELAKDSDQPAFVRDDAVRALREYGSLDSRRALVPLALEPIADDEDDEIKGAALGAVFPQLVSVQDVFDALTPPRNRHLIGAYSSFLHRDFPAALAEDDLPTALRWCATLAPVHRPTDNLYVLADAILCRAWPHIAGSEEIASLVASVVLPRLKAHADLLSSTSNEDPKGVLEEPTSRRRLIEELVPGLRGQELGAVTLVTTNPELLHREDLGWALSRLEDRLGADDEAFWADVVRFACSAPLDGAELEALDHLCDISVELRDRVGHWLQPIEIDSELARSLRGNHRANVGADPDRPDRRSEIDEEIESFLDGVESGDGDAWWRLNYVLQFDEHGQPFREGELEADLTLLPGWQRSSATTRERILRAARDALEREPPGPDDWFASQTLNRPAYAGYRALHLLAKLEDRGVSVIATGTWERWMPIVVDFPTYQREERLHDLLLETSAIAAPGAFTDWVDRKVSVEAANDEGTIWFVGRLAPYAPAELRRRLLARLDDDGIRPNSARDLLGFLLGEDSEQAFAAARPWLGRQEADLVDEGVKEVVVAIASTLLSDQPALAWPELSVLFTRSPEVGKEAFAKLAHGERNAIASDMPDADLAELTVWAFGAFPEESDPPLQAEAHFVSPLESARRFRGGLLHVLSERGSDIAIAAIEDLYATHETISLRFAVRRAKDARRSRTPAPTPVDIVRMLSGSDAKPTTCQDLAERVQVALEEIGRLVQIGQPPVAAELWNTRPDNTPKDEGHLTNWLAARLKSSLGPMFEVTREPLVRGGGKGRGKSADILVSAAPPIGDAERLRVLIEVKGSWERAVKSKMRSQLAEGYMPETGITHAFYLVFWFPRENWAESDDRRRRSTFPTVVAARSYFDKQAAKLSEECGLSIGALVIEASLS
jgi:hypothetical protein